MTTIYSILDNEGDDYVARFESMIDRHIEGEPPIVLLTQGAAADVDGITYLPIDGPPGDWAKINLFNPELRGDERVVYMDLDTVLIGDLGPLLRWSGPFATLRNPISQKRPDWPAYDTSVMAIGPGFGKAIYTAYATDPVYWMSLCAGGFDDFLQRQFWKAPFLQDELPDGYFIDRRQFSAKPAEGASVLVFGGLSKPHNTPYQWIKDAWLES